MADGTLKTTVINPPSCRWCGMTHGPRCPSVKALEYHPDGTVKRVEFFAPNDYPPIQINSPLPPFVPNIFHPNTSGHAP